MINIVIPVELFLSQAHAATSHITMYQEKSSSPLEAYKLLWLLGALFPLFILRPTPLRWRIKEES